MSTTITRTLTIRSTTCGVCGILFGLESSFREARLDDGRLFYCPNGHRIGWEARNEAEATQQRLERQLEAARSLAARESERRKTAEYQRRAAKGQLTKAKKRAAAGTCPCCKRTFQNVTRHMEGQHPEFVEATR